MRHLATRWRDPARKAGTRVWPVSACTASSAASSSWWWSPSSKRLAPSTKSHDANLPRPSLTKSKRPLTGAITRPPTTLTSRSRLTSYGPPPLRRPPPRPQPPAPLRPLPPAIRAPSPVRNRPTACRNRRSVVILIRYRGTIKRLLDPATPIPHRFNRISTSCRRSAAIPDIQITSSNSPSVMSFDISFAVELSFVLECDGMLDDFRLSVYDRMIVYIFKNRLTNK